jgi:hypothetical protein
MSHADPIFVTLLTGGTSCQPPREQDFQLNSVHWYYGKRRSRLMRRSLTVIALLGVTALALGLPAAAQARVFVGVGIGVPLYAPYPAYYYPAPAVYYPPPAVVYAPSPAAVYAPPTPAVAPTPVAAPAVAAPPAAAQPPAGNCRQYRGDATIDGVNQPFYGTACLQGDGKWHVVN